MRQGNNPNRYTILPEMPRVVMAMITHLPERKGYHAQRLEVVKLAYNSMITSPGLSAASLVWDNGSCDELRQWLLNDARPDYLVLSDNIGKSSARASILRMFPDDTIVGISDDDILFYPGWLKAQVDVLNAYPRIGLVSGYPVRTQFRWGCSNTIHWAQQHAQVQVGKLIPEEWDRDFCTSIGRDYQDHLRWTVDDMDYLAEYNGVKAYLTGHHCQFLCRAGTIAPFAQWSVEAMADEKPFDIAIDNAGWLRLTTAERTTRHIGNQIDDSILLAVARIGLSIMQEV